MWRVHVIDAIPIKMLPLLYISQNEHQGQSSPCFIYMEKIRDRYGGGESTSNVRWSIRVAYIAGKSIYVCNTMKRLSTSARRLRMIHQIYFGTVVYELWIKQKIDVYCKFIVAVQLDREKERQKLCLSLLKNHRLDIWPFVWKQSYWTSCTVACPPITTTTTTTQFVQFN